MDIDVGRDVIELFKGQCGYTAIGTVSATLHDGEDNWGDASRRLQYVWNGTGPTKRRLMLEALRKRTGSRKALAETDRDDVQYITQDPARR